MYTLCVKSRNVYNMEPYCRYFLWRPRMWITYFAKTILWTYNIDSILNHECKISRGITSYGPPEAAGTAKFCLLMDSFFGIMNVRNIQSHEFERKPFLAPFTSVNDDRFGWLQNVFLKYFEDWLTSIEQLPGNFSRNARSNMFIFWQTFEVLKITVHSIIEVVKCLSKFRRTLAVPQPYLRK